MRAGGGRLINLGSMSAFGPVPRARDLRRDEARRGILQRVSYQGNLDEADIPIRVHAVCPDSINNHTGMVHERTGDDDSAIIFSAGKKLLDPGEVADRMMELLDSEKLLLLIPGRVCRCCG